MDDMIKVKTADLAEQALDWAVAQVEGKKLTTFKSHFLTGKPYLCHDPLENDLPEWSPSTDWSQCGPLIQKHKVGIYEIDPGEWRAGFCLVAGDGPGIYMDNDQCGPSALIAACRAIVAAHLGEVVSVPAEVMQL